MREYLHEKFKELFYCVGHPADGFYELRHREGKGSVPLAFFLVILFSLSFTFNRLYAGFVVNDVDPRKVNLFAELLGVLIVYVLLFVGNWSVTCPMKGEGRVKDIATALAYSLVPLIICINVATLLSRVITVDEKEFYFLVLYIGIVWTAILALKGNMEIHSFSLSKTIVTLVLTLIAVLIIVFMLLLVFELIQRVVLFITSIYYEIIFRT